MRYSSVSGYARREMGKQAGRKHRLRIRSLGHQRKFARHDAEVLGDGGEPLALSLAEIIALADRPCVLGEVVQALVEYAPGALAVRLEIDELADLVAGAGPPPPIRLVGRQR